ncbi:hypothetical protein Sjap_002275 [Stephania japonica]|uniref:Uncharacterized protein n=1 Tax=Stephania japonica TaxID=461633 RepID=A0AAP0PU15_9MAGN
MHNGTKSPGPLEEPWTHGGIKSPTHIYYILVFGRQGEAMTNETMDLHLYSIISYVSLLKSLCIG